MREMIKPGDCCFPNWDILAVQNRKLLKMVSVVSFSFLPFGGKKFKIPHSNNSSEITMPWQFSMKMSDWLQNFNMVKNQAKKLNYLTSICPLPWLETWWVKHIAGNRELQMKRREADADWLWMRAQCTCRHLATQLLHGITEKKSKLHSKRNQ